MKKWTIAIQIKKMLQEKFRQIPDSIGLDIFKILEEHQEPDPIQERAQQYLNDFSRIQGLLGEEEASTEEATEEITSSQAPRGSAAATPDICPYEAHWADRIG